MTDKKVLITGASGRIGRAAARALHGRGWAVVGYDRVPGRIGESVVGDLTDLERLQQAAVGSRVVIHLAATPDDADFMTELLPNNIVGLHHVLEASRMAGVDRIVLGSTGQVNWWQQIGGPWPVRAEDPICPRHWYAVTKVALEAAGMAYARQFGMTVIAVRLGWCPRTRAQTAELETSAHGLNVYLSPRDAGDFFVAAASAPVPQGYHLVFATSNPMETPNLDMEPAKQLLGWWPSDTWPAGSLDDLPD